MTDDQLLERSLALAAALAKRRVDTAEVAKLFSYYRMRGDRSALLGLLNERQRIAREYRRQVQTGKKWQAFGLFVRSESTARHIEALNTAIPTAIHDLTDDQALFVLGWAVRLMRYYKVVGLEERAPKPPRRPSERPSRPPAPTGPIPKRPQDLKRDMVLQGVVKRIMPYGAFVDIGVRRDGLLHISELSERRVAAVTDVVREGDRITVRVKKVERRGGKFRISLSMKGVPQE